MRDSDALTVECLTRGAVVVLCDACPFFVIMLVRPARKGDIRQRERTCVAIAGDKRTSLWFIYIPVLTIS